MSEHIIRIKGLTKAFNGMKVLKGIDIDIEKGSAFCLLGSNGAGKTTTIKILTTLLTADQGEITVCGYDVRKQPREVRRSISFTGQYAAVDEILTGRENMHLAGRLFHVRDYRQRTERLLSQFGLADAADRRSGTYSGGMRRKLDICMSLMGNPQVLFLDEPTTGLDPQNRVAMWEEIDQLKRNGITIFLTTQYLEEAERLSDHVAILHGGVITVEGTVSQLKGLLPGGAVRFLFDESQYGAARELLVCESSTADDDACSITVMTDGKVKSLTDLLLTLQSAGVSAKSVQQKDPTLEDVFFSQVYSERAAG